MSKLLSGKARFWIEQMSAKDSFKRRTSRVFLGINISAKGHLIFFNIKIVKKNLPCAEDAVVGPACHRFHASSNKLNKSKEMRSRE
jgi:hypothetical protein